MLDLLADAEVALMIDRRERVIGTIMSRVWVDPVTGCWNWTGPTSGDGRGGGYGRMSLDGQTVAVHIVSFTHFYGYVPGKKQVDHKCRNRLCCNPTHLESVTPSQNARRRSKANKAN
jgi:hypothetical protein